MINSIFSERNRTVATRPRTALTLLMAATMTVVLLMAAVGPADAAGPARPAAGGWKLTKDSSNDIKGGSMTIVKGKKVKGLSIKPKPDVADSCGSSKPIKLVGKLPIQRHGTGWAVRNKEGTYGHPAKFKQGSETYKNGSLYISFQNTKKAIGMVVTGEPGCYAYFNAKKK